MFICGWNVKPFQEKKALGWEAILLKLASYPIIIFKGNLKGNKITNWIVINAESIKERENQTIGVNPEQMLW